MGNHEKSGTVSAKSTEIEFSGHRRRVRNVISDSGHEVDALGHAGEEGRFRPRKSSVSCQKSEDPGVSEWGNPTVKSDFHLSEVG